MFTKQKVLCFMPSILGEHKKSSRLWLKTVHYRTIWALGQTPGLPSGEIVSANLSRLCKQSLESHTRVLKRTLCCLQHEDSLTFCRTKKSGKKFVRLRCAVVELLGIQACCYPLDKEKAKWQSLRGTLFDEVRVLSARGCDEDGKEFKLWSCDSFSAYARIFLK